MQWNGAAIHLKKASLYSTSGRHGAPFASTSGEISSVAVMDTIISHIDASTRSAAGQRLVRPSSIRYYRIVSTSCIDIPSSKSEHIISWVTLLFVLRLCRFQESVRVEDKWIGVERLIAKQ